MAHCSAKNEDSKSNNIAVNLVKDEKEKVDKKPEVNKWLDVPGNEDIKKSFENSHTITWENGVKIRTNQKGRRFRWSEDNGGQWVDVINGKILKFKENGLPFTAKFMDPSGNLFNFPSFINKKLKASMLQFCGEANLDIGSVRFLFDGRRLRGDDTPEKVELEEGDVIEVYQEQHGGRV